MSSLWPSNALQIAVGGSAAAGSAKTLPPSPCRNLRGRVERCDAERPQELLGLHFPNAEPSCTGPALVRAGRSSHKGLGKKGSSAGGWFLHTHKLDPSGKNLTQVNRYFFSKKNPKKPTNQKTASPAFFVTVFFTGLVGMSRVFSSQSKNSGSSSSLCFLLYSKEVKMHRRDYIWAVEITYSKTSDFISFPTRWRKVSDTFWVVTQLKFLT